MAQASNVQAQLLRCVKALGAFDLQLLQLCPEITSDGLCAMQVGPHGWTIWNLPGLVNIQKAIENCHL